MTSQLTIDGTRLRTRLLKMIESYSPSGKEEALTSAVARSLVRQGLPVRRQAVDDRRSNLIVPLGSAPYQLALVGHLDTIQAHDLDACEPRITGDRITGLGAADMKGGCAALIEVALTLFEAGYRDLPVVLCLVVGEEEEGDGAAALVDELRAEWAIVAEPTDLVPCLGQVGYVEAVIEAQGPRVHASLAESTPAAVNTVLSTVLELATSLATRREVVLNVRGLSSSPVGFVVPDRCAATLDLHVSPGTDLGELTAGLEDLVGRRAHAEREIELALHFETIDAGYQLPEQGELIDALRASYAARGLAWAPAVFRSHADASALWAAGFRPIVLGPGRLEEAHTPDEYVDFRQVLAAAELYLDLVLRLGDR